MIEERGQNLKFFVVTWLIFAGPVTCAHAYILILWTKLAILGSQACNQHAPGKVL